MSQQLLPNASTSSSDSSTASSTRRPATSTTELWSSTQKSRATLTRPQGAVPPPPPPTAGPCRPLPAPPSTTPPAGLRLSDDLTTVPCVDSDRLRHVDTLGTGRFGQVWSFSLHTLPSITVTNRNEIYST